MKIKPYLFSQSVSPLITTPNERKESIRRIKKWSIVPGQIRTLRFKQYTSLNNIHHCGFS